MQKLYPTVSVGKLTGLFGKSRQAYYQAISQADKQEMEDAIILRLVSERRKEVEKAGTIKLMLMLNESFKAHNIKIGRDKLYNLLKTHGLLLRNRKRRPKTTDSNHRYRKYPNLIRDVVLKKANTLWVCDITYISINYGFAYLSLVTDAYSHKIVGYTLNKTLGRTGPIKALKMALQDCKFEPYSLIHHSDRGIQYCCNEYIELLEKNKFMISMTEKGDPYENAIAERVNGILKTEFNLYKTFESFEEAEMAVIKGVSAYNNVRLHASCDYLTPSLAHSKTGPLARRWKNYKKNTAKSESGGQGFGGILLLK